MNLKLRGIYSDPNSIGSVPEGALLEAENVVIDSDDIVQPRRGFKTYGSTLTGGTVKQLLNYKDVILRHQSDIIAYDSLSSPGTFTEYKEVAWIYADTVTQSGTTATFTSLRPHKLASADTVIISGADQAEYNGEFSVVVINDTQFTYTMSSAPGVDATGDVVLEARTFHINQIDTSNKVRGVEAVNSNFYFTSDTGTKKLDAISSSVVEIGAPKALDVDVELVDAATSPIMPQNSQIAYRVLWGYRDANQNLILGAPSNRVVAALTAASLVLPDFNTLLDKLDDAAATRLTGSITNNTIANPTVVTSVGHGLVSGQTINITGSNSTPSIDGLQTVTVLTPDTFTVPVNVTVAGSAGTWETQALSDTDYNTLAVSLSSGASTLNASLKALTEKLDSDLGYSHKYGRFELNDITIIPTSAGPSTVTITTANPHNLAIDDVISITDSNSFPSIDGTYTVTGTPSGTEFQILVTQAILVSGDSASWASGVAANYPQPTTETEEAFIEQQEFLQEIIDLLLSEPLDKIDAIGQTAANFQDPVDGKNPSVTFTVPQNVTTNYLYQIYRTRASAGAQIDPGDDMGLVYEANPTATEIKNGTITIVDETPDDFRGADLYSNPRQEGILQANEQPPFAKDIAIYKNIAFYANTKTRHKKSLSLLGVTDLLGTKIWIGGIEYTFAAAENINNAEIAVVTTGTPAQNVDDTARSLVRVVNRNPNNTTVYAYYDSGVDEVPGKLLFEAREISSDKFFIMSNSPTIGMDNFSPSIAPENNPITAISATNPAVVTTTNPHGLQVGDQVYIVDSNSSDSIDGLRTVTAKTNNTFTINVDATGGAGTTGFFKKANLACFSDNETVKNRVYYSKQDQYEAVPLLNFFNVGSGDKEILRIVPLRDSLFILKDDGIYRITGETPNSLVLSLFDTSVEVKGPDTVAVGNNQIHAFSNQGVCIIADTGVQIISRPVEDQLLVLAPNANIPQTAFAVFYQTDRKYILWLPDNDSDTVAKTAWVYNNVTQAWTTWDLSKTCALVNTYNDKLYLGAADINSLEIERKDFTRSDFADREYQLNVLAFDSSTKTVTLSSVANVSPGDVLVQTISRTNEYTTYTYEVEAKVISVDRVKFKAVTNTVYDFIVGPITAYKAYQSKIVWAPEDGGNEGEIKHFREATLRFKRSRITTPVLGFSSDLQSGLQEVELIGPGLGNWGTFPWGKVAWGGDTKQRGFRTYIPLGKQRCSLLNCQFRHFVARESWELEGLSLVFEMSSPRINR